MTTPGPTTPPPPSGPGRDHPDCELLDAIAAATATAAPELTEDERAKLRRIFTGATR